MKIWIINHYAKHENRHYFLAKHLIQRGHDVTIIASSFDHKIRQELHLQKGQSAGFEDIDGVPFVWIKTPAYSRNDRKRAWNMLGFCFKIWRPQLITQYIETPDIIIGSSPHLFTAMGAQHLAKYYRVPFV